MLTWVLVDLALRNLRRHLRRTVLTGSAMVVGGAVLVFSFTLDDGSHEQWIDSGVRLGTGHVTVERPEYRMSRRLDDRLTADVRRAAEQALESPEIAARVVAASARLGINGLASSAEGARPAQVVAVDPIAEADFGTFDDQLIEGRYLEPGDELAACVGDGLAASLQLDVGSRFVIQAQDTGREIAGQLLRVVGIFHSGVPAVDRTLIHIPLDTAADWLGSAGDVTSVAVVLDDSGATGRVAEHLEHALGDTITAGDARVLAWRESDPALAAAIAIDAFASYVIHGFLFAIIAFGIVNTVLMSVMHRHREFGVLQALGLTPRQTAAVVLIEGLTLSTVSGLAGVGLGLAGMWFFFGDGLDMSALMGEMTFSGAVVDPVVVPRFLPWRVGQITVFILCIGIASSIYPAWRAARIDVTEAMKFDR